MQQLTIEHKKTTTTTDQKVVEAKDRRIAKGMVVVMSCEIVQIHNDEDRGTYKVQSESNIEKYYIVKFMDGAPVFCSCKDFEIQSQKNRNHICKHQRAIVLAENYGLVVTKQQNNNIPEQSTGTKLSYQYNNNDIEDSSINDNEDESSNSSYQSQNATKFEETMMTKTTVGPRSYKDDDYTF